MRARLLNARTPDEVFYDPAIRIPRREPDESFGYLFFDLVENGRMVGNNGILYEGRIYRLVSLQKHLEYWGERVDVRVNPDNQREAMVYDRQTGAYVCKALVDMQDATYDTRDEVTRQLIARVFSDGKHLLRMAKAQVEGAKERLVEYRRAKIEYLLLRYREIEEARRQYKAVIDHTPAATVIGPLSGIARQGETASPVELTASMITEVMEADLIASSVADALTVAGTDAAPQVESLCVVSTRERKAKVGTGRQRRDGALRYEEIAEKLGTSRNSLAKYRKGLSAWPEGMKEQFEMFERLRSETPSDEAMKIVVSAVRPVKLRRTRSDGEFSYENIAIRLGMTRKMLHLCRQGKRPWPEGKQAEFEKLERRRVAHVD